MKKTSNILLSVLISGGLMVSMAPAAMAQTYVYPITPSYTYGNTGSYVAPSYTNYSTTGCIALTNYLTLGSSDAYTGGQVTELQQFLNRTGYLNGVTGYFDQGTYGAVVNYQVAHGISATGSVGPITRASINQQSCSGYGYTPTPVSTPIPVPTPVVPSNNCYYENGVYECTNNGNYNYNTNGNGNCSNVYNNSSYYYNSNENNCGVTLNSVNASYNYSNMTLTLNGNGFTSSDTVYFDGSTYNGYSSNGSMITVTIPSNNYYSGNYNIYVTTQNGLSSNTISFPISSSSCTNNNCNNGNGNSSTLLGSISGPTSVQTGTTNTWTVNLSNNGYYYGSNYNNSPDATITINWGDNSSSNTQSVYSTGSQALSFSHAYNSTGTYTINVSANSNGQYSYQTYTVTVYGNGSNYYYGTPTISYLSPSSGNINTTVAIEGSGFSSYGNTVHFGSITQSNLSSTNGDTIYYTIPGVSSGSYPIYITNNSGQSSNTEYFQAY